MENLFGSITLILATAMACFGLPMQIKKTRETKKAVSRWLAWLAFSVYASRSIYSGIIGSYFILIPDIFGVIFSLVIVAQCYKYPEETPPTV